jgi:hypothetical protein
MDNMTYCATRFRGARRLLRNGHNESDKAQEFK